MGQTSLVRSFMAGLGVAMIAAACGGDNIAGPRNGPGNAIGASASVADTTAADSITVAALAKAAAAGPTAPGAPTPPPDSTAPSTPSTPSTPTAPTTPPAPAQPASSPAPTTPAPDSAPQLAVTRTHPLSGDITVSAVVGPKGGKIEIGEAGLTVVFSKGAVLQNTTITVTADAGSLVSYEFGPHGTQFFAPVAVEQDMRKTSFSGKTSQASSLYGGYLVHGVSDITGDSAKVSEFHAAETSQDEDSSGRPELKDAVYVVWHFSGYILISARR